MKLSIEGRASPKAAKPNFSSKGHDLTMALFL